MEKRRQRYEKKLSEIAPNIFIIGEFKGVNEKVEFGCRECGGSFVTRPDYLYRAKGCLLCREKYKGVSYKGGGGYNRKSKETFISELKEMNPTIELISEYNGSLKEATFQCKTCSYKWTTSSPVKLVKKDKNGNVTACPRCKKVGRMTHEEFIKEATSVNDKIEVIGRFTTRKQHLEVRCRKEECGHIWKMTGNNILKGRGCPKCCGHYVYSHDEYVQMVKDKNEYIEVTSQYKGMNEDCSFFCKKHNIHFTKKARLMIYEGCYCGCFICNINRSENEVYLYLQELDTITMLERQKTFPTLIGLGGGRMSYDFYVEIGDRKILIERQGEQHERPIEYFGGEEQFKIQQEHDRMKKNYAETNGFEFIEIWYYEDFKEKLKQFEITE